MIRNILGLINKNEKGFTLLELVIAIAIVGVIVPVLSMSVAPMFKVSAASINRLDTIKQIENALHYINQDGQMAWPSQTSVTTSNSYFSNTTLTSGSGIGDTTLHVDDTSGFSAPGTVVIGTGASSETLKYSAKSATTLTVETTTKAHSSNDPVSNAIFLKWTDHTNTTHVVTYSVVTVSDIKYIQRSEIVDSGSGQPSTIKIAGHIDSSTSYYTFDEKTLNVNLTASISGFESASESRALQVKLRPTQ